MSDSHAAANDDQNLFAAEELKQFAADDAEAGRAIGKMLSIFFFYTVIVMGISSVATYYWITTSTVN